MDIDNKVDIDIKVDIDNKDDLEILEMKIEKELKENEEKEDNKIIDIKTLKKKLYTNKFLEKNKDKLKEKHICKICKGSYTYFNITKHKNTKRHKSFLYEE